MKLAKIIVFVLATIQATMPVQAKEPAGQVAQIAKRQAIKKEWMASFQHFADKSGDSETKNLYKTLSQQGVLVAPLGNKLKNLEPPRDPKHWIGIMPLVAGDEKQNPAIANMLKLHAGAFYSLDVWSIGLRGDVPLSPDWQGHLLRHEMDHAIRHRQGESQTHTNSQFVMREWPVHKKDNEVALKVWGKPYAQAVEAEAARQQAELTKAGAKLGDAYARRGPLNPVLEKVFGPAKSEKEKVSRQTQLWIHGFYRLTEKTFPGDPQKQKQLQATFLLNMYINEGVLKKE